MADSIFEEIKHVVKDGFEFWDSRRLAGALGYADYRNFETVIAKAKLACKNSGHIVEQNFTDFSVEIEIGKGASVPCLRSP